MTQATNRMPAGNTGFASGGVTCKLGALCFYSSSVLVDCFVLRNPPERKARKRCKKPFFKISTATNVKNLQYIFFGKKKLTFIRK